ncbi:hypothetical protein [Brevundimonas sp.]|uniref:hypothetical protein n=1 Tax=Brevundimonas sp. TaxID=1871086 RepID=UPI002D3B8B1E|nr:hypothetical protein [Brevundimonas sp.]HYC68964.1 hypothetical protein [Brevundimonas sp.]
MTETFPVDPYWVLSPARHFAEPAEERGFVTAVVERLSAEARDRSGDAVAAGA